MGHKKKTKKKTAAGNASGNTSGNTSGDAGGNGKKNTNNNNNRSRNFGAAATTTNRASRAVASYALGDDQSCGQTKQAGAQAQSFSVLSSQAHGQVQGGGASGVIQQGWEFCMRGRFEQAELIFRHLAEEASRYNDHCVQAQAQMFLGRVLLRRKKPEEAYKECSEALQLFRKMPHDSRSYICFCLDAMGSALGYLDRLDESEQSYRELIRIQRGVTAIDCTVRFTRARDFGKVMLSMCKMGEAKEVFVEALELSREAYGSEHEQVAESLSLLGNAYLAQGEPNQAESLFRESLVMQKKLLGSQHPDLLRTFSDLSTSLSLQGNYEQAEKISRTSISIQRRIVKNEDPPTNVSLLELASMLHGLGDVLLSQKRLDDARDVYKEALALSERASDSSAIALSSQGLGSVLMEEEQYAEAEQHCRRGLSVLEVTGKSRVIVQLSINVAKALFHQGKVKEGAAKLQRVVEILTSNLDADPFFVFATLNECSAVLRDQGKCKETRCVEGEISELKKQMETSQT